MSANDPELRSAALIDATPAQPRARLLLARALAAGPSHAYLFQGPRGSGKRAAARAFAAEILAASAADSAEVRRRALLDPSPHPDLVWLEPSGAQYLLEEVRERVIRAAAYRPYESARRVFVIARAEAMREETQNALLKTLEEPPSFAHLILLSAEPEMLKETISSRCQRVEFSRLSPNDVEAQLADQASPSELAAVARLCGGDAERARFLLSDRGRGLRAEAEACVAAALGDELGQSPWRALLEAARTAGEEAEKDARAVLRQAATEAGRRADREIEDEAKRIGRRRRTEVLELCLELCAAWFRDLGAVASGAAELVLNRDRADLLQVQARSLAPERARQALALVTDTRRRLELNVSEELALEALFFRLAAVLTGEPVS